MDVSAFLSSLLGCSVGVAVIGFISKKWIEVRIQQSIKHKYDLEIEKLREATLIKTKAQLAAELFAEWLSHSDDQRRLNQLTLEAFLWMPEDILHDLSNCLSHKPGAPSIRELVIRVRSHLLGASTIPAHKVIIFSQETRAKMEERHKVEVARNGALEAKEGGQADEPVPGGSAA